MRNVTLMYLRRDDKVLMAMKKRGFGEGKWNAPGGKAEPGENTQQAAVRECQEEVGVTPHNPVLLGDIEFYMPDMAGFEGHHIYVYAATEWNGEPVETEEMRPQWFRVDALPYDNMWPADRRWLPDALSGQYTYFTGKVIQGPGDTITEYHLHEATPPSGIQS
jgi:8-oxo-dGTP diphosphatase